MAYRSTAPIICLPTDIPLVNEAQRNQLKSDGFMADDISERLRQRGAATTVMILDACRNNPFKASGGRSIGQSRGLSRMDARRGLFVMFSAGTGQEALDRLGHDDPHPNSVFTRLFVDLVKQPDLALTDVAKELQIEVPKLAASVGHEQFPAYYDEVQGKIFLARAVGEPPPDSAAPVASPAPPAPAPSAPPPVPCRRSRRSRPCRLPPRSRPIACCRMCHRASRTCAADPASIIRW